jgi:glutamyl-tRNA synthetase/glutamyl-Q tRNA(Asp) synthetase
MGSLLDSQLESITELLKAEYPAGYTTRFAPSPTGYLHIGHIASMLLIEKICNETKGKVILRIEDHDQTRSRDIYIDGIKEDLHNLGFKFTNMSEKNGELEFDNSYLQSNNRTRYDRYLKTLIEKNQLYACSCTRKEVQNRIKSSGSSTLLYDSKCVSSGTLKKDSYEEKILSKDKCVRYMIDQKADESFNQDPFFTSHSAKCLPSSNYGDFILFDKDNNYTYQFCVVCDDIEENIDVVIRGEDLIDSTTRQINLMRALSDSQTPRYFHHPLIKDSEGMKLSKRFLSTSVRELMNTGMKASEVRQLATDMLDGK